MQELKDGEEVSLEGGASAKVIKELGRGGQGIVYLVEIEGQQRALKWYHEKMDFKFCDNLYNNVVKHAPSEAFLWPEYVTDKKKEYFGYVMKLRPEGYEEFGQYLLAHVHFRSFDALLNAACNICESFDKLHAEGYSYQDLNDGNFFIHPETGDVVICDNDNIAPNNMPTGILGKARYMAPEVVIGKMKPCTQTDRYSLGVILFLLFFMNHPLEGAKTLNCPCMTEKNEKKFYGEEPVFICDPNDDSNRPVRGVHTNVLKRWNVFPLALRKAFEKDFSHDTMIVDPSKRKVERIWKEIFLGMRDHLVICPHCGRETFVDDANHPTCMNCKKDFPLVGILSIDGENRNLFLTLHTTIYLKSDEGISGKVVRTSSAKYPVQIQNLGSKEWIVETSSGKLNKVNPQETMPIKSGLKVTGSLKWKVL